MREAARLAVTGPVRVAPADEPVVAAVLRRPVHRLERVRERGLHELHDLRIAGVRHERVLSGAFEAGEAATRSGVEAGEALSVDLLQPAHGPGELALGQSLRSLQPDAPAELGMTIERHEVGEVVVSRAGARRERAPGVDE